METSNPGSRQPRPRKGYVMTLPADYQERVYAGVLGKLRHLELPVVEVGGDRHLGTRPYGRARRHTVCVAFRGRGGQSCGCSIYPDRPRACRRFEPYSLLCKAARREAGLPA